MNVLEILKKKREGVDKATVVGLSGDLGSGKTAFSQAMANILGVTETVTSPTFIIEKLYHTKDTVFPQFVHIDAYRLDEARELEVLGFKDLLQQRGTLVFIEWPERVKEVLPLDTYMINFKFIDEDTRMISYNF
ncbi:MAG: tRNA (adenosine(37)-N6)-threonylcarbamoyltransferase complex ATPase subunit type 1 TsaE [Patescibacteria group bacterium]